MNAFSDGIAPTPEPPYYAVIFTSIKAVPDEGYADMAAHMLALAAVQPGFLGVEAAREDLGITVSYWRDLEAIANWKAHAAHVEAQRRGREQWYTSYRTRICEVKRDYAFEA